MLHLRIMIRMQNNQHKILTYQVEAIIQAEHPFQHLHKAFLDRSAIQLVTLLHIQSTKQIIHIQVPVLILILHHLTVKILLIINNPIMGPHHRIALIPIPQSVNIHHIVIPLRIILLLIHHQLNLLCPEKLFT